MVSEAKTIMVVEDEVTLLQVIAKKLKVSGYSTITCISAKQAIDYLKNLDENPTAIWLDYYLPEMSGMDFMVEISNNAKWRSIPVIVVSNSAGEEKKTESVMKRTDCHNANKASICRNLKNIL